MKYFILFILSFIFSIFGKANDEVIVKKKTYSKEYSINANTTIKVRNSYGDITYETWNENKVSYFVEVIVDGRSETNVSKKLSNISVDFSSGTGFTLAKTVFENQSIKGVNIKINYTIKLPKNNNIDIGLNYGDIHFPSLSGTISVHMNYGDIHCSGNLENLQINSNYTDANLANIKNLTLKSNYGDFNLKNVKDLSFSGNYSDIIIQNLENDVLFKGNYSDLKLLSISSNSREINLSGNYLDFEIYANNSSQISLSGNYSEVNYTSKYEVSINKNKNSILQFEAKTSNSPKCSIKFKGNYSDFNLK